MENKKGKLRAKKNVWSYVVLIVVVILLVVVPLTLLKDADFLGSDGLAERAITQTNPGYEPWFTSFFEPPSGEVESLLFALQASIGTAIIFYIFGYWQGRKKGKEEGKL